MLPLTCSSSSPRMRQILEPILRKGIEGIYELLEDFPQIAEDICQRTIAIGLVNPGIDFIVFPQFWRPRR